MTIKISQLANLTVTQANTIVPVVSNITGTLTTVQANVQQLQTFMQNNAGNLIPAAGNVYSIGSPTVWWKDLWLSANTLYIGGIAVGTSGGQLTFGGNAVGTSGLDTYTGNVSASNVSVGATTIGNVTTAPTFSVEGTSGNITAGNIASVGNLATASVATPTVTTDVVSVGSSVDFVTGAVPYDGATMISGGSGYGYGYLYYPSGGTGTGLSIMVQGVSYPDGEITGYTVYQGGSGYTIGDVLTIDAGDGTAQFTVDSVTTEGTLTSGASSWTFDPAGDTTFPGGTVVDSAGNVILSDMDGNTTVSIDSSSGNISAGNVSVYSVESDTLSLTLPTSASDVLPSYDGGITLLTGTVSTNLNTQYWGFNPAGVTWFTVNDATGVSADMLIYWAGRIIGTVTGVSGSNISCTPLTATPNFINGSPVSFGGSAPLYTDTVTPSSGDLTLEGNVSIPGSNLYISSPTTLTSNITVLSWLTGPSDGNLNITSDSGQSVELSSNAGATTWTFNSNGSVTFPDNTLQTTAGTYSNTQVSTYLSTYSGNIGSMQLSANIVYVYNPLSVGFAPSINYANTVLAGTNNANGYVQLNIQNINTFGNLVSADFIATAPDGTDSSKYIDMGINGNNYSSSSWTVSGANDGYVYINSGNLTLGTDTAATSVKVHVGGTLANNVVTTFRANGVTFSGNVTVANTYVPTLANSIGTTGQITYDSNYIYVCIATNTWKRANISTW